ncbi:hypothetical protein N9K75_01215 [bacterium]|nr:hypothetical protein [bacterium]
MSLESEKEPNTSLNIHSDIYISKQSQQPSHPPSIKTNQSKMRVKNIHSEIFKEFRKTLYIAPKYNQDEITTLLSDQEKMEDH